ncbi:MAG: trypsin-like serine protease [Proteobacteria bacterium]|nr:trypsin-like serine protease [Pseudomonadota bacterium]
MATLLLSLLCLFPAKPSRAVIGGEELAMRHYVTKYVVGIRYEDDKGEKKICGGSIIGSHLILTAAHCISRGETESIGLSKTSVVFGDSMRPDRALAELAVSRASHHQDYEKSKSLRYNPYDVAVIRTKDPLPAAARHFQLAASYFPVSQIPTVYVLGYGAISVGRDGKPVGQGQLYSAIAHRAADHEDDRLIVVDQSKGTGICTGDDGGPMVVENDQGYILMGIASTVSNKADEKDKCAGTGIFLNVHALQEWIIQQAFELMQVDKW